MIETVDNRLRQYVKLALNDYGYVAVQLEVCDTCFQQCVTCQSWREREQSGKSHSIDWDTMVSLHAELKQMRVFENLTLTGGDPLAWLALWDFLDMWIRDGKPYRLQISTAMPRAVFVKLLQDEKKMKMLSQVSEIRLSLDAYDSEGYQVVRGTEETPIHILKCMEAIGAPFSILTCVSPYNLQYAMRRGEKFLHEMHELINQHSQTYKAETGKSSRLRKWIVLPMLGHLSQKAQQDCKLAYQEGKAHLEALKESGTFDYAYEISVMGEDRYYVEKALKNERSSEIPCYVGVISCHIKPDGKVYPCCLVGGEAIETLKRFRIGDIHKQKLSAIQNNYVLNLYYDNCKYYCCEECCEICLYKQFRFNELCFASKNLKLAMP